MSEGLIEADRAAIIAAYTAWKVEQPQSGVFRWTLPSGRARTTRPTTY
jgi:hypothetical protein